MRIKISTDSTADIPHALCAALNIDVLPLNIIADGKEYRDGVDIRPEAFYKLMPALSQMPSSAQVNPYRYTELFEAAYEEGTEVLIHVAINAKGSATYQSGIQARSAFYEEHPEAKERFIIHVLDSASYSAGYGLAVVKAAEMARDGESAESILAFLSDWFENVRVLFVPLELTYVKKSGRISAAAAFLGDAMGLKPVILFEEGEAKIPAKIRGERKAIRYLLEQCKAERKSGTPFALAVGDCPEEAALFREEALKTLGEEPLYTYPLGCVISINTGPRALGIVYRR